MIVKEFKEMILAKDIPDAAQVYVWADHGQRVSMANIISISRSKCEYGGDNMIWEYDDVEWEDYYDEDALEGYDKSGKITAICIGE